MNMNDAFIGSLIFNKNGGGGASALEDLSDINITAPQNGQALIYDEDSEKWVNGQGGGAQVALTQAEYDALVQAGAVDPTTEYFITDGIPSSVEYYHNYSTNEQIVGTWVDGSPVYEKTVYSAGGVTGNFDIPHNISNIDRVISYSGTVKDSDFSTYHDIWSIPRLDKIAVGIDRFTTTAIKVVNPTEFNNRLVDWYITLRYTKSSS
jgi:hypothetical protein